MEKNKKQNSTVDLSDPSKIIGQLMKMNQLMLSPYQKGVNKKLEEMGAFHTEEGILSGVPPENIVQQSGLDGKELISKILEKAPQESIAKEDPKGLVSALVNPKVLQPKGLFTTQTMTPEGDIQLGGKLAMGGMSLEKMKLLQELTANLSGAKAQYMRQGGQNQMIDMSSLSPEQQIQAYDLARRVAGVRGAVKLLPSIVSSFAEGKTIDQIEDELRFSQQSNEFSNEFRNASQQMTIGKPKSEKQASFDELDDLLQKGDTEGAKEYLKEMARVNVPAEMQTRIRGKERTMELLGEIEGDLATLEKAGIKTGFTSGSIENWVAKVGQVASPELRQIATKIATAVINYRRDMTGVQFGEKESREYKILFPSIDKVGNFNTSALKALKDVFKGDLKRFYTQKMGSSNYNKIFKEEENNNLSTISDDMEFMKKYEQKYGGQ